MIKINDNIYIKSDKNCYIVCKYLGKNKKNEDVYDAMTYHRTLKEALSMLIRLKQYQLVAENEMELTEQDTYNMLEELLISSIPQFEFPRVDLTNYEQSAIIR